MGLPTIIAYTDGACKGNPGPGGWAYHMYVEGDESNCRGTSGSENNTTNNQMELLAVIKALGSLKQQCVVRLHTDSQYVKNGCESWMSNWKANNWRNSKNKPVLNSELWKHLDSLLLKHRVLFFYVKAHNGDKYNEMVDTMASNAALSAGS